MATTSALDTSWKFWATVGLASSLAGAISETLAFGLPYWVSFDENVFISGLSTNDHVTWSYHYGFWWYCNHLVSHALTSSRCGGVATHKDWEQTVVCLMALSVIMSSNAAANAAFYLTCMRNGKFCLYVCLSSASISGFLLLVSVITYGTQDQTITVSTDVTFHVTTANLGSSFWLTVGSCVCILLAFLAFAISTTKHVDYVATSDSRTSLVTLDSHTSATHCVNDNKKVVNTKDMANWGTLGILVDAKTTEAIDCPIIEDVNCAYRSMATCAAKDASVIPASCHEANSQSMVSNVGNNSSLQFPINANDTDSSCSSSEGETIEDVKWTPKDIGKPTLKQYRNVKYCINNNYGKFEDNLNLKSGNITFSISKVKQGNISPVSNTDISKENIYIMENKEGKTLKQRRKSAFSMSNKQRYDVQTKRSFKKKYSVYSSRYAWTGLSPVECPIPFELDIPVNTPSSISRSNKSAASTSYDTGSVYHPRCLTDIVACGNPSEQTNSETLHLVVKTKPNNGNVLQRANTDFMPLATHKRNILHECLRKENSWQELSQTYECRPTQLLPICPDVPIRTGKEPPIDAITHSKDQSLSTRPGHCFSYLKQDGLIEIPQQNASTWNSRLTTPTAMAQKQIKRKERRPDYVSYKEWRQLQKTKKKQSGRIRGQEN